MGCGTRSKKALIVDDEPLILETLQYGLRPEGYVTSRARSGQEALAQLHRQQADVVLLDVEVPEKDGWETCRNHR